AKNRQDTLRRKTKALRSFALQERYTETHRADTEAHREEKLCAIKTYRSFFSVATLTFRILQPS
ncbi:MAG: hypothetical protein RBR35_16590, partial [Salinivirgaceae bacterium]|nr:hypothetical protein [Salinivirgaceae bacterium]